MVFDKIGDFIGDAKDLAGKASQKILDELVRSPGYAENIFDKDAPPVIFDRTIAVDPTIAATELSASADAMFQFDNRKLRPDSRDASFGVVVAGDRTPVRLDISAGGPGTDWQEKGKESSVLSVYVDGQYQQDIVLWGGERKRTYSVSLGELDAGKHNVTLRYAEEKSSREAKGVDLDQVRASVPQYGSQAEKWAAQHAPILIGKKGTSTNHTDTPLGLFHKIEKNADVTTITYGYIHSNEDGGTALSPPIQQARWGRLTDLESVFIVKLDGAGKVLSEQFEDAGHVFKEFEGQHEGDHPIIRTATRNNTCEDEGSGLMRFRLPTDHLVTESMPEEEVMRRNPAFFALQTKELYRENKIDRGGLGHSPGTSVLNQVRTWLGDHGILHQPKMADPRHYVYVQFETDGTGDGYVFARAHMKDGTIVDSHFGNEDVAISRDGWVQTSIRLPKEASAADVRRIELVKEGTSKVLNVGHIYSLGTDFRPHELTVKVDA